MATSVPPPPSVLRSQHNLQTGPNTGNGARDVENDAFGNNGGEWQAVDYWYNRVLDKSNPAANTANPSALGLIAFGYTTALLQVTRKSERCAACAAASFLLMLFHSTATFGLLYLQGANTHWTEETDVYITVAFALFFGGLVQLLAGMWEFRRNNMFAATALSSYGGFWLGFGIYQVLTAGGVIPESGSHGLMMTYSLWGILTFFYFL